MQKIDRKYSIDTIDEKGDQDGFLKNIDDQFDMPLVKQEDGL